ncbi:uncharacterized protein LOC141626939 isoform X2 [Silene latifolia]|uniref:uncharacterized protein LOC141626939 isoform X2 n=1 Tax=Silene latifolia TaxID=37657 RepID=UPI003D77540F
MLCISVKTINKVKKPSPASSKAGIGKIFTPLGKIIRDSFASFSSTPSRASVSSVSQHPSAIPQSEAWRSRVALEKAFDRSRRLDQQLKCPSTGNVKSSTQSPANFASFSFRTEERAAKRREKKLEKEAENMPFTDNTEAKSTPDSRKSSQSRNLKPSTVATIRTEVLSDNLKKIPPSQQSQKCEARPASDLPRSKSFHPSQRAAGSKKILENSKALPSNLTMKKKRHENTSPNIL